MLANEKPGDATAELYQGGIFAVAEEVPNPAAPKKAPGKTNGKKKTKGKKK